MSLGVALSKLKVFAVKETLIYSFIRVIIGPIIGLAFVKFFNLSGVEAISDTCFVPALRASAWRAEVPRGRGHVGDRRALRGVAYELGAVARRVRPRRVLRRGQVRGRAHPAPQLQG